jgi:hypothetical protein
MVLIPVRLMPLRFKNNRPVAAARLIPAEVGMTRDLSLTWIKLSPSPPWCRRWAATTQE